jgi:hypothetical protein
MTAPLYQIAAQHRGLQRLAEEADVDGTAIADTLEGLVGDFEERANAVAMVIGNLEASAEAISDAAKQMQARAKRLTERSAAIKAYLKIHMQATGITKISCPYFVITLRKNPPRVEISDEGTIPDEFRIWPEPPPPTIDRKALLDALKKGREIPGAQIAQDERIEIKS